MSAQPIDIMQLPVAQLQSVKQQVEQDLQILTSSFTQLREAQSKFNSCIESLTPMSIESNKDETILIPLTNSLYVPAKIKEMNSVIVDVGTGYFVEKSVKDAKAFYQKKVDYLRENLEKLTETIGSKQNQMKMVTDVIQFKSAQEVEAK